MIRVFAVLGLAVSATCGNRPTGGLLADVQRFDGGEDLVDAGPPDCSPCEAWGLPQILSPLPPALEELSGLAVSGAHRGVVYAHNDSGDSARFFAFRVDGVPLGEFRLEGVDAIDWEDMALGPCAAGTCVYLADFGDNLGTRSERALYRVAEPTVAATRPVGEVNLPYERFTFNYPDGVRHNAETLLVHPRSGDVYVLTKGQMGERSHVFKFPRPLDPSQHMTLVDLGRASVPDQDDTQLTGGAVNPCGTAVLLRLYNRIVELRVPDGGTFDQVFSQPPTDVPMPIDEPQGEAVSYGPDGQSYFTASERYGQSLHRVVCRTAPK